MTNRRTVRAFSVKAISLLYLVLAPLGVLLTATRGAFLAELVAALIVPLSLAKQSFSSFLRVSAVLAVMIGTVALAAPPAVWDRLGTIPNEVAGGSMSTRREIWTAGLRVFPERPVLGSGAGAYGAAIDTRREFRLKADTVAHNMLIGLLVEQGVVGLALFLALLGACAVVIFTLPDSNRMLWAISHDGLVRRNSVAQSRALEGDLVPLRNAGRLARCQTAAAGVQRDRGKPYAGAARVRSSHFRGSFSANEEPSCQVPLIKMTIESSVRTQVPFYRPDIGEPEIEEVVAALRSGWLTTGPRVKRFEEEFAAAVAGAMRSR